MLVNTWNFNNNSWKFLRKLWQLKINNVGNLVIFAIWELLKPWRTMCMDLCACACVHPFMKLWNSYKGSLNRPALPGKGKLEGSNSKITLNHMSWLIKIMCCMNLKAGKKKSEFICNIFGTQNTSQRSYLSLRHRCCVNNYCAFNKDHLEPRAIQFLKSRFVLRVRADGFYVLSIFSQGLANILLK